MRKGLVLGFRFWLFVLSTLCLVLCGLNVVVIQRSERVVTKYKVQRTVLEETPMTLISRSLIRKIVLLLAPIAAFFMASPGFAQKPKDESRSIMTWEHSDDGHKRRLEIRGKAEFNDDYTDIQDVSEGGVVRIEEVRDGQSRRYEVRRDIGGQLTRAFFMNGQAREIDATARTWIAELVLNAVRQGGIDADKRVQTILRQRGVAGVFQEIEQITSDYARRRYYDALVKHGNLNAAALADTLA